MVDRLGWTKRQFRFELPLGMYGYVLERARNAGAAGGSHAASMAEDLRQMLKWEKDPSGRDRLVYPT